MELLSELAGYVVHLDRHLDELVQTYGTATYLILFAIVFCETGLVVTPFLPGDSLLFAAGAIAGRGTLSYPLLLLLFGSAALCGDNVNYFIGRFLGPRLLKSERSRILNRKHLEKTHAFFEKYGGKTIIIARFVPIVRTFTPFVAGIGAMTYPHFLAYCVAGAALWVGVCVSLGYFFGSLPIVRENFTLVVFAIILISVTPALIEFVRHRRASRRKEPAAEHGDQGADKEQAVETV